MKRKQPLGLAIVQEILIFLAFVGGSTILWLASNDGTDWWHGALPELFLLYPFRLLGELIAEWKGRPPLRLMPEDR